VTTDAEQEEHPVEETPQLPDRQPPVEQVLGVPHVPNPQPLEQLVQGLAGM
jgi:hypothetical protein